MEGGAAEEGEAVTRIYESSYRRLARTAVAQWIAWWAPEPRRTRGATTLSGEELAQN